MIRRLIAKYKLWRDSPYKGDIFYGDPFDFVIGSAVEQRLHGMYERTGNTRLWEYIPSDGTYRLTIEMDSMPYYRCTSEVLCTNVNDPAEKKWLKRVQPRRIPKDKFHEMILDGRLKKQ
jgi:hypothetical protein